MKLNDLDAGWRPAQFLVNAGQQLGNALVQGARMNTWALGASGASQDVHGWIEAWQALGGQPAQSLAAIRLLRQQFRELADNPDMQPVYLQPAATAQVGQPSRSDLNDGWYNVSAFAYDPETYNVNGAIEAQWTVVPVAPSTASLAVAVRGGALSSTFTGDTIYSGGPVSLVSFPVGSTVQAGPPTGGAFSRTGAEGAIPVAVGSAPTVNPVRFVRPATVAGLFTGGVRVFDTMAAGGNPVPTAGTFTHPSWVQVYGTQRDFQGDCIVTNGLLLLLFGVGQGMLCTAYVWNTSLGTPAWQSIGMVQYLDDSVSSGTLREINLERVGLLDSRLLVRLSTAGGNWAQLRVRLTAGSYAASVEFTPLTQANTTSLGLMLNLSNAAKIIYDDAGIQDLSLAAGASVAPSTALGMGAAFGTQANSPIFGFVYQSPPSVGQPSPNGSSTANVGFGDASGPAQNASRLYGIFAVPFGSNGASTEKLQAEAESGALGTGWSSVADASASGGNTAKAASGTASGNADLFGTAWQPPPGNYDAWARVRVTSAAGSAAEMTLGIWDPTAGTFTAGASQTFRANQASTSYVWLKINVAAFALPPAGPHNVQFRALTAATLGTDWFIDQMVLTPSSQGFAAGRAMNFPTDLWAQWAYDARLRLVIG